MSSLSYLSVNPTPMMTLWSGNTGSTLTFFDSLDAWNAAFWSGLTYPGMSGMPASADYAKATTSLMRFFYSAMISDSARLEPAEAHSRERL